MKGKLLDPETLSRISGLTLQSRLIVDGLVTGLHRSPLRGRDVQFAEYREYSPGDELRHLDWKVYAKTGRHYVKLFEQETTVKVQLVVDCSRSMLVSTTGASKLDYAQRLAAALAYLFLRQGDSVGLLLFDGSIRERIGPAGGVEHFSQLAEALLGVDPGPDTQIGRCLNEIAAALPKRQIVLLISDLLDDPDRVIDAVSRLRARSHEVVVFQLLDPQEIHFEFHGALRIRDLESGRQIELDADHARSLYRQEVERMLARYEREMSQRSVDYVLIETSENLPKAILRALSRHGRASVHG